MAVELSEPKPRIKRKYTKRVKAAEATGSDEIMRLVILTAINTLVKTLFNVTAIIAKDQKWNLTDDEAIPIAQDLDACLALLPGDQYEVIIKYIGTISPFASLATNIAGVIKKRIEANPKPNTFTKPSGNSIVTDNPNGKTNDDGNWRFDTRYAITSYDN